MATALSDDLALRLGLASKSIPQINLEKFLSLLTDDLEGPLTEKKLRSLSPKKLFKLLSEHDSDIERGQSNQAYAILTNDSVSQMSAPQLENVTELAGPKLRLAVTSNNSDMIDGHFGSCLRILIYEVNKESWQLCDVRPVNTLENGLARTDYLVSLMDDCQLMATLSIGGPAAAKVTRADIHPLKQSMPTQSSVILEKLIEMLNGNPPPWIKKILEKQGETHE